MSVSPENVMKGGGNDDTDDMENKSDDSTESKTENVKPASRRRHRHQRKPPAKVEWEVIEGLKQGQRCETKPEKHEGYMMKRRKWPLKGWHKRYFALEKGFLAYGKTAELMHKGKLHGSVDVGLSVVSVKQQEMHIDIDAEDFLYHLKVKEHDAFEGWVKQLRHHRLYRQHELSYGVHDLPRLIDIQSPTKDLASPVFPLEERVFLPSSRSSSLRVGESHGRLGTWIRESAGLERYDKELTSAHNNIFQLGSIIRQLRKCQGTDDDPIIMVSSLGSTPTKRDSKKQQKLQKAETRKKEKRQKESDTNSNSSSKTSLSAATLMATTPEGLRTSSSNPNLPSLRPTSLTDVNSPLLSVLSGSTDSFDSHGLHDDFVKVAEEVHDQLRGLLRSIQTERDRLKNVLEHECNPAASASASPAVVVGPNATVIQSLRIALNQAVQQNAELRARLSRIHVEAMVPEMDAVLSPTIDATVMNEPHRSLLTQSLSNESSSSLAEFFDAEDAMYSAASDTEASESEAEISSDFSDEGTEYREVQSVTDYSGDYSHNVQFRTGRRSRLPASKPDASNFNIWSLLRKNIGKDLSKISMPVTLNEPLSTLQRMCEDLEYSELLDKAAQTPDPYDRMVLVAAFAVSGYAATYYRAGSKPFNPLLGETYECLREDRGFRYIAEQVSHHPPVSACHADSKNFIYFADIRFKNKFWGRSLEVQPIGTCTVVLPRWNEKYKWNKVTTCIHNLLGGQRWVDQYGEMFIQCNDITCKMEFSKAAYWSEKASEVHGVITDPQGNTIKQIFGKWNETFYCGVAPSAKCVWRPGAMPQDYEQYYGFTRFAIELNELESELAKFLPPTDTRFRPDQRALEEGLVDLAEAEKLKVEQMQRERRKNREESSIEYEARWFRRVDQESWVYNNEYWNQRKEPGFMNMTFTKLW